MVLLPTYNKILTVTRLKDYKEQPTMCIKVRERLEERRPPHLRLGSGQCLCAAKQLLTLHTLALQS